jgi:hypothetical protein
MALGSTQPLTLLWGVNLLEPCGLVQACNGTAYLYLNCSCFHVQVDKFSDKTYTWHVLQLVPHLQWRFAGFSTQRFKLNPREVRVEFAVDKTALGLFVLVQEQWCFLAVFIVTAVHIPSSINLRYNTAVSQATSITAVHSYGNLAGRQAGRQAHRQTDRQTDRQTFRSALFWGITQRRLVILYRLFGTAYRSWTP